MVAPLATTSTPELSSTESDHAEPDQTRSAPCHWLPSQ